MRPTHRLSWLLAVIAILALLPALPQSQASARLGETTYPVLDYRGAADPTVVRYGDLWVTISTGPSAPRAVAPTLNGPWTDIASALTTLPPWALSDRIWASDLVQTDTGWVLYFSAPVAGLGPDGRCIGAATAATPLDAFVPQERPLVCPRRGVALPAHDNARPVKKGLPKRVGVIDPEGFEDRDGRRYVLYRTQSRPSSIRIVRVPRSGLASERRRDSVELFRRRGVVENPVLVRRGEFWVLITSQNYFGGCNYLTTWRKARSLEGLGRARKHTLIDQTGTGLCGPGGADLVVDPTGAAAPADGVLALHAWTCPQLPGQCPAGGNYDKVSAYGSHRAMFLANLTWSDKAVPQVVSWVAPVVTPWQTPTPTPTQSPTVPPPA